MKNRKVLNLRTHIGGWLGKTSYDSELDNCEMELCPVGVVIKTVKGKPVMFKDKPAHIISLNSNNIEAIVAIDNDAEVDEKPENFKRGPGRPAKDLKDLF